MLVLWAVAHVAGGGARIVTASPYDRELDMVRIAASEHVGADRSVLCESDKTQAGHPRPPRLDMVKTVLPEVEVYRTTCRTATRDYKLGWGCEGAPRDCAARHACKGEPNSTVVVLSDADEIVAAEVLASLAKSPPGPGLEITFKNTMSVHMYGFFWESPGRAYSTARAFTCGGVRSRRRLKSVPYPRFSGWHCSYCFPVDEYLSKMHSMLKGDGWLSLSDHYWSMETMWAFRQNGLPFNGKNPLQPSQTPPPRGAQGMKYLTQNTNMSIGAPEHPFSWPRGL